MALPAAAAGPAVTFTGMTHLGLGYGYDLQYHQRDAAASVYLCVGREDNRILVTGTTRIARQPAVLNAIDQYGKWGEQIELWMVAEKNGVVSGKTPAVKYLTHVKPYGGRLTISDIAADQPAMTYPGNGKGRLLTMSINDKYYFQLGGKLETSGGNRGFDCTTFPMALLSISRLPAPGYGKQLCDAAGAVNCELEQIKTADLQQKFTDKTIPNGIYILFSAGHVMLYNADINILYEFNIGGFKSWPAAVRPLRAPQDLWWMRKLDESYRRCFG